MTKPAAPHFIYKRNNHLLLVYLDHTQSECEYSAHRADPGYIHVAYARVVYRALPLQVNTCTCVPYKGEIGNGGMNIDFSNFLWGPWPGLETPLINHVFCR